MSISRAKGLIPNSATCTPTRVSPANFDMTHFVLENPIITVLDTLLFITDLLIYVGTSPPN